MRFRRFVIQALKFLGFLAAGIFLLWLAFRKVDFHIVANNLREANYIWLLLSMIFSILAFFLRARRWQLLIHPLGVRPAFWHTFHAEMIGYLANLALPRIGEITRCVALGRKEKIAVDKLVGTVIIERTIDFMSVLIFLVVILLTSGTVIRTFLNESLFIPLKQKVFDILYIPWFAWAGAVFLGIAGVYFLIRNRKSLKKIRFFSKLYNIGQGIITGIKTITNLERKWEFMITTLLIWIIYAFMTWVVVFCLKSTAGVSFRESLIILVVGGLAMSVPVQGGFGAFHYGVSRVLAVIAGVSLEDGLTFAVLSHESQIILEIIIGVISIYMMYGRQKESIPEAGENSDRAGPQNG